MFLIVYLICVQSRKSRGSVENQTTTNRRSFMASTRCVFSWVSLTAAVLCSGDFSNVLRNEPLFFWGEEFGQFSKKKILHFNSCWKKWHKGNPGKKKRESTFCFPVLMYDFKIIFHKLLPTQKFMHNLEWKKFFKCLRKLLNFLD